MNPSGSIFISGPSDVCDAATYTLSHLPEGAAVQWFCSDNLRIIGGQGDGRVDVERVGVTAGPGWLQARIFRGDYLVSTPKYPIQVGTPTPFVMGPYSGFNQMVVVPVHRPIYFKVQDAQPAGVYSWRVFVPDGAFPPFRAMGRNSTIRYDFTPVREGLYRVECRRRDAECGLSEPAVIHFEVLGGGGLLSAGVQPFILLSPNPASVVVTVSVGGEGDAGVRGSEEAARGVESVSIRLVEVYDWQGQRVLRREFGAGMPSVTVGLEGLRPGVYTVVVNGSARETLVVE